MKSYREKKKIKTRGRQKKKSKKNHVAIQRAALLSCLICVLELGSSSSC